MFGCITAIIRPTWNSMGTYCNQMALFLNNYDFHWPY